MKKKNNNNNDNLVKMVIKLVNGRSHKKSMEKTEYFIQIKKKMEIYFFIRSRNYFIHSFLFKIKRRKY